MTNHRPLCQSSFATPTRRSALVAFLAGIAGISMSISDSPAKKRSRSHRKPVTMCHQGATITVKKKHKRKHVNHGDTIGPCASAATCISPDQDLHAILVQAEPGSVIQLCAGTWRPARTYYLGQNVQVAGAGIDKTIFDGNRQIRLFSIGPGVVATLQNLTVTHGAGHGSGGIVNSGALTLQNCRVANCHAGNGNGGGIATYPQGSLTLIDSVVEDNVANNEGGGIFTLFGTLVLNGSRISNNTASGGGGIAHGDAITLRNGSVVSGNRATQTAGGGILMFTGPIVLESGSAVTGNFAAGGGGGIYGSGITLGAGAMVTNNTTEADGGGILNGGALVSHGALISGNRAQRGGGVMNPDWTNHGRGPEVTLAAGDEVRNNTAEVEGGGIHSSNPERVSLASATIVQNNHLGDGTTISNCAPVNMIPNCIG